jgi:Chaperone of endosialidase
MDDVNEIVRFVSSGTEWTVWSGDIPVRKSSTISGSWNEGGNRLSAIKKLGTISNHDFLFMTNNYERMRITTSGFLGIGTSTPEGRLQIVSDNDDNSNDYFLSDYLNGTGVTAGLWLRKHRGNVALPQNLQSGDIISQYRVSPRYNNTIVRGTGAGIDAYYLGDGTTNSTDMRLFTSGTEAMRIIESGNVGIGSSTFSSSPEKLLVDAGNTLSYNVISGRGEIDNYLQLNIQNRSSGNTASSDVVATSDNGDENVNYIDMGINSSGYTNSLIPILNGLNEAYLFSTGANFVIGNGSPTYDLSFFTNGYALTNERMRITAAGDVGIGTSTPADKLTVAGILAPSTNGTFDIGSSAFRWSAVWSANGTIQTSDARYKMNVKPLEYGLKETMLLQPVRYQWKDNATAGGKIGLLAQEVQKLVPEVVTGDEKKQILGMNYSELLVVLINTIQQQQQHLRLLKKELKLLEKSIH